MFYKILGAAVNEHKAGRLASFLDSLIECSVPRPGEAFQLELPSPSQGVLRLRRPDDSDFPLAGVPFVCRSVCFVMLLCL